MPEVVEVCLTAQFLNKMMSKKELTDIQILGGRYSRHKMKGINYFQLKKPFKINKVDSKGKFLWFDMTDKEGNKCYILNRFGLEGEWGLEKNKHSNVLFIIKDKKNDKSTNFYFTDSRNFGTIEITSKITDLNKELNKLGPDFLKEDFNDKQFHERIGKYIGNSNARKNQMIVKVLMNQKALGSGLGNYLTADVLNLAKISPYKKLGEIYNNIKLSDALSYSIKFTTKLSYIAGDVGYLEHIDKTLASFIKKLREDVKIDKASGLNFHPDIKIKKNEKFKFRVYRQIKDPDGNPIIGDRIIPGRTTYWAPAIQK